MVTAQPTYQQEARRSGRDFITEQENLMSFGGIWLRLTDAFTDALRYKGVTLVGTGQGYLIIPESGKPDFYTGLQERCLPFDVKGRTDCPPQKTCALDTLHLSFLPKVARQSFCTKNVM